eukprot:13386075-Heterocapsa_arctica.AAC.1
MTGCCDPAPPRGHSKATLNSPSCGMRTRRHMRRRQISKTSTMRVESALASSRRCRAALPWVALMCCQVHQAVHGRLNHKHTLLPA